MNEEAVSSDEGAGNTSSGESRFLPTLAVLVLIGLPFLSAGDTAEWSPM